MENHSEESLQSPWLLCLSYGEQEQLFCNAFRPQRRHRRRIPNFWKKTIWNYTHGWILLNSNVSRFMLFNPQTQKTINLPVFLPKPNQDINDGILWLPPDNPKSMVLIFDTGRKTIRYCYIHKKQWIETSYKRQAAEIAPEGRDNPLLFRAIVCNGRLYALLRSRPFQVVEIDVVEQTGLRIKPLGCEVPLTDSHSMRQYWWLAESRCELFAIDVAFGGVNHGEVIDAGVYKWDFDSPEKHWRRVKGSEIKDRAFFVCGDNQPVSCSTTGQNFQGGHIYFAINRSQSLCLFDIDDGSVTVSIPSRSLSPNLWVMMSDLREETEDTKVKKTNIKSSSHPSDLEPDLKKESVNFCDLPCDIVKVVSEKLMPLDYMNFRATCKSFYLSAPAIAWRESSLVHGLSRSLLPLLMFSKSGPVKMHHFLDPKFGNAFTINADESLADTKIRYSKEGWVLMNNMAEASFFFYNPFTKETIEIPRTNEGSRTCDSFCFSHVPSSPECVLMGVQSFMFIYFKMREQQWGYLSSDEVGELPDDLAIHNTPVFFQGAFYFLGTEGSLSELVLEYEKLTIFDRLRCPCEDFYQNFLLEWDGKLVSVFVDDALTALEIFKFNKEKMFWEEVSSLGKYSLFLGHFSAFSTVTNVSEMEDKVYLSRIHGEDNVLFYCLKTKRYGYMTNKTRTKSFSDTKEYLSSCWIDPNWTVSRKVV